MWDSEQVAPPFFFVCLTCSLFYSGVVFSQFLLLEWLFFFMISVAFEYMIVTRTLQAMAFF